MNGQTKCSETITSIRESVDTQVIVLRALQSRLLEALSNVHNGAAQLAVLKRPEQEVLPEVAAAGAEPSEGERERLLSGAKRATRKCIESTLSVGPRFARCLELCRCS